MSNFVDSWRGGGTGRGAYTLVAQSAAQTPLTIQLAAGATANGFLVENSAGTDLFSVSPAGNITIAGNISAVINETVTGDLALTGALTVTGASTLNGAVTLGDASTDAIAFTGTPTFATALSLTQLSANPTGIASTGRVYSRLISGITELFYLNSSGIPTQITNDGAIGNGALFVPDQNYLGLGNTAGNPDVRFGWNTTQTVDGLYLGLSDGQNTFIIAENGDRTFDFAHGAQTNPTVFIHSASQSTTQWLSLTHNQTDGVITTGAGAISLTPSGVGASSLLLTNSAGARTVAHTVVTFNGTAGAAAGGTFMDINVSQTGAGASPLFDIDVSAVYTGEVLSVVVGAALYTSDLLVLDLGATSTAGQLMVLTGGAAARTTHLIELNDAGTSTGIGLDLNKTGGSYSTGLGYIDLVRSGSFTGVDTETAIDFRIAPSFTLTEPAGGTFTLYGAVIDLSGIAVTAGVGTTVLACLNLVANADADVGTNLALRVGSGVSAFGGNITPLTDDGSALGTTLLKWADLFLGSAGVINFNAGDVTITHGANTLAFAGASSGYTFDAEVTITRAGTGLDVLNTTDGASVQIAAFEGDRATMADNDEAYLSFELSNDAGTQTEFARLTWVATDVNVATSVDGRIDFAVMTAGSLADEMQLDGAALSPSATDGLALGTTGLMWSDLFLAAGGVINFDNGNLTLTQTTSALTLATAATAGGAVALTITPGAHTAVTANRPNFAINANTITVTGAIALQQFASIAQPTITAATAQTVTAAQTFSIDGAPIPTGAGPATIVTTAALNVTGGAMVASAATTITSAAAITLTPPTEGLNTVITDTYGILARAAVPTTQASPLTGALLDFDTNFTTSADALSGLAIKIDSTNLTSKKYVTWQKDTTEVFAMTIDGVTTLAGRAISGGGTLMLLTGGAHTAITAATENAGFNLDFTATKTWAAGAGPLALQREIFFQAPTYNGDVGGALTITEAATVAISGAPTQGTNITLSETHALLVMAGSSAFGGNVQPRATDGAALGTSAIMWSDLFLASGAVINFNNGDVTLTHTANELAINGGNVGIGTGVATIDGVLTVASTFAANTPSIRIWDGTSNAGGMSGDFLTNGSKLYLSALNNVNAFVDTLVIDGTGSATPYVGIGTATPAARFDVADGGIGTGGNTSAIEIGADLNNITRTNVTRKLGFITGYHRTNAEEPVALIGYDADTSTNIISIGGGSSGFNAATTLDFYTAVNSTTVTGSVRMSIDSAGLITTAAGVDLNMSAGGRLYGGGIQGNFQTLAANTNLTLDENDHTVAATLGSTSDNTITLPAASGNQGMEIVVYVADGAGTNNAVVTRAGADTIDNGSADLSNTTVTLQDTGDYVHLRCVGSAKWTIIHESGTTVA